MVAIFIVPISLNIKISDKYLTLGIEIKKAEAINIAEYLDKNSYIKINSISSNSVNFSAGVIISEDTNDKEFNTQREIDTNKVPIYDAYLLIEGAIENISQEGVFICYKEKSDPNDPKCLSWRELALPFLLGTSSNEIINLQTGTDKFPFKPNTTYILSLEVYEGTGTKQSIWNWVDFTNEDIIKSQEFTTTAYNPTDEKNNFTDTSNSYSNTGTDVTESFNCSFVYPVNVGGCILEGFNYIWKASFFVGMLAGSFLDFFVYYATNSSSYSNIFIEKAWSAVRDVANIFFIVALLYVAIKTILNLNVTDNKKLIGYVVIIALIINFSLFTTKIVIDGSNILAKIFYNNIVSKDTKGNTSEAEAGGQKSISVGLISKFNPQSIVSDAYNAGLGLGYAIFIVLLLIAITLYAAYIFFSIAILFVARVVSLWISMIFSPLAFVSYTVPFDIPGFGHKEWWDDLLKNAFLAPLFTFMLYIIVMFTGFLTSVVKYADNPDMSSWQNAMQHVMSITIPFIILMMLLTKSKSLVVKYSGEMGKAVMTGAKMIGGVALGAATGGMAMAGRATLGRAGAAMANSATLKSAEARGVFGAKQLRSFSKFTGSGSFDARGIKIAGKDLASTGLKVNTFGKQNEGGFVKRRADQVEKRQKRAKELEVGEDETLKQDVHAKQNDLDKAKSDLTTQANITQYTKDIADREKDVALADREVIKAERELKDTIDKFGAASTEADTARANRTAKVNIRDNLTSGVGGLDEAKTNLKTAERPIKDAEKALKIAENLIISENRTRRENFAKSNLTPVAQTISFIMSGGQHSFAGEREASNKILSGIKEEKK
ncbi:TPA: hypothetical protein DD445_01860 [Candidatus Nomurabacteria bacterium]|nr:hypothetical protein [Candidatus Nomurabacteria bacterium]HBR66226.1 hypothetical protein [Candidatus Nomurabacteria bacterium]HCU47197.1 hypothetical protein [Candidatus Nomurabacteria bacterium]